MPEQTTPAQSPAPNPVKLHKPEPIRRGRARDYSHWQQSVQVELKTDTAQRFLERNFNQTNENLQYLDYMLVILRDDAFAKPLADELGTMFAAFITDAQSTIGKLRASCEATTLPFAVKETSYDNARSYEAVLLSGNSVDMLAAIVELDALSMMIDTARGKRVISTFDRKNLLEQWVDTLTRIVRRVRAISTSVRDRNNELRKEREERQARELEARNRERNRQDQAREEAHRTGTNEEAAPVAETVASEEQIVETPEVTPTPAAPENSDKILEANETTTKTAEETASNVSLETGGDESDNSSAKLQESKTDEQPTKAAENNASDAEKAAVDAPAAESAEATPEEKPARRSRRETKSKP